MKTPFGKILVESKWNERLDKDKWKLNIKRGKRTYTAVGHWRTTFRKGGKGRGRNVFFGVYTGGDGKEFPFMHGAPPGWNVKPDDKKAKNITKKGKSKFRPPQMEKLEKHRNKIKKKLSRPGALSEAKYNKAMEETKAKLEKAFSEVMESMSSDFAGFEYDGRQPKNFDEFTKSKVKQKKPNAFMLKHPQFFKDSPKKKFGASKDQKQKIMLAIYDKAAPTVAKAQKLQLTFAERDKDLMDGGKQSKEMKAKYGVKLKTSKGQNYIGRKGMEQLAQRSMVLLSEAMGSKKDNLTFPAVTLKYTDSRASMSYKYDGQGNYKSFEITARDRSSGYHEFAHWLEHTNSQVSDAGARFWMSRTKDDVPTKMRQVCWPSYPESEVTCPDKFTDPYVGKMYKNVTSTEVVTMGVDKFAAEYMAFDLMRNDPDHFVFALAVVNGAFGKGVK